MTIERRLAALLIVLLPAVAAAHHGSSFSYDTSKLWTTWATVTGFNYKNPHPTMTFDRTTKDGKVEHWVAELLQAPAPLARAGWGRKRSEEALKPGTRVKLYIGTARAGGTSGIVMRLENEKGEEVLVGLGGRGAPDAVDLDGVPGGLQPSAQTRLPGQSKVDQ
jgi:Family of unknown function (DUF6152)